MRGKFHKPLEGVKVADFTWALVGPLTTKTLADYGAEVVKIEGRSRLDSRRYSAPFKDSISGVNRAGGYNPYNTNKLSIALNLALPKGIEIAKRLVAWADVVVENFSGGTIDRMGLGYEELKKTNPDIIMLSSCPMGQTGPHSRAPAIGVGLTALSGITQLTGWPDRAPVSLGVYTDFISPHFNALAILAALDYRRRTGKGQYLDLSQFEDCLHFMAPLILDHLANGRTPERMGNRSTASVPHNAYRCLGEDRWCAIAVTGDAEWNSLLRVMGDPAWAQDERFNTSVGRKRNEDELDKLVESWTVSHKAEEVMASMQAAGVPAGVLESGQDLLESDPQLKYRRFFTQVAHPEINNYWALRPHSLLSRAPVELTRAPLLGEHNYQVLGQILEMSDEEIGELVADGVLE